MIVRNSQSYRLLTLVAMSGECSKEAMELLMPQDSYRKKLMMQLTGDNLIKGYEKNAVKGYRLSRRGKMLLLQMDKDRFGFFLEEGADANYAQIETSSERTAASGFRGVGDDGKQWCRNLLG